MTKKRFKAVLNDMVDGKWEVWLYDGRKSTDWVMNFASFEGKYARQYARDHARRLNEREEGK